MIDILGNEHIRKQFSSMIQQDRLHHCLLFEGPKGVGKYRNAKWLTQLVLCPNSNQEAPCGKCHSCLMVENEEHWNVIHVGLDESKKKMQISVAQARELIEQVSTYPRGGGKRVVIIDDAWYMKEDTSNALLKTFEEPMTDTMFILITTSAQYMLPTVRSRSQRIRFSPVSESTIQDWMVQKGQEVPEQILALSQGCPGRVQDLLMGEYEEWLDNMEMLLSMFSKPLLDVYELNKRLFDSVKSENASQEKVLLLNRLLDCMEMLLRDIIVWQTSKNPERLIWKQKHALIEKWALKMDDRCIADLHNAIEQARIDQEINVNGKLQIESLVTLWKKAVALGYIR